MVKRKMAACMAALMAGMMLMGGTAAHAAESGKHINGALYWFGTSLDPHTEWDGWTTCRAGITETLITINEKYEIVPLLADSWEQVDDTTWKFHIREGVTFHNGKAVDAEAVKKSFERAMEVQDRAVTAAKIDHMEAEGQDITFVTTEPFGAFLANLTEPMYSVIDVEAGTDFASAPIATGPYKVTDFEVNTVIELERNADYWNGASDVDTMTIKNIEDDTTRGMALQSGEMDIVQRVAWTDIPMYENDETYDVYDTQGARTRLLMFNYNNEKLQDLNVRKAIMESIDYDAIVSVLGSGVSAAGAPYPASAPYGYDELDNKQAYNPEDAAACLAAAGYADEDGNGYVEKDGEELTLTITYMNTSYTTMLEAIQDMGKQAGIHYELNLVDSIADAEENRSFDIIASNWQVLSTGDPQWILDSMYKTGNSSNYGDYSNAELDAVIDKMSQTFDLEGRTALTLDAQKILLDDVASIYLVGENNFVVARNNVRNVVPYPIDYYFVDNGLTIE